MKTLGMATLMTNGLNYRKALVHLGFAVNDKGRVTMPGYVPPVAAPDGPATQTNRRQTICKRRRAALYHAVAQVEMPLRRL